MSGVNWRTEGEVVRVFLPAYPAPMFAWVARLLTKRAKHPDETEQRRGE